MQIQSEERTVINTIAKVFFHVDRLSYVRQWTINFGQSTHLAFVLKVNLLRCNEFLNKRHIYIGTSVSCTADQFMLALSVGSFKSELEK